MVTNLSQKAVRKPYDREWSLFWSKLFLTELKKAAYESLMLFTLLHGVASTPQLLSDFERGYQEASQEPLSEQVRSPQRALNLMQEMINDQELQIRIHKFINALVLIEKETSRLPLVTEVTYLRTTLFRDRIETRQNIFLDEQLLKNFKDRNLKNMFNLLNQKENPTHE